MKYYDCSVPLTPDLVTWQGEKKFQREVIKTIQKNEAEVSALSFGAHLGTHLDAPRHFVENAGGIDQIPLSSLLGPVVVVQIPDHVTIIEPQHLAAIALSACPRILFKTANSTHQLLKQPEFCHNYVALSPQTAELLVQNQIKLVGIDYLSIEKSGSPGHPVHTTLLGADVVILEGLILNQVPAGNYLLTALPLRIVDGDGSPARVVLSTEAPET